MNNPPVLSPRLAQIDALLRQRRTTRQIAATLGLSPRTVECYKGRLAVLHGQDTRAYVRDAMGRPAPAREVLHTVRDTLARELPAGHGLRRLVALCDSALREARP